MTRATSALRWTLLGTAANRALSFFGLAVIGRLVAESDFGEYRQIVSLHLVLCASIGLGFDQLFIREVAHRRTLRLVLAGAVMIYGLFIAVSVAASAPLLGRMLQLGNSTPLLYVAALVLLVQAVKGAWKAECVAKLNFRRITTAEAANTFVTMVIGAALMFASASAWLLYLAYAAGEVVEFVLLKPKNQTYRRPYRHFTTALRAFRFAWRRHRRFSIVYSLDQLLNTLSGQLPVFLLTALLSKSAAGNFAMANALIQTPFILFIGPLSRVALPALSGRSPDQMTAAALRIMQAGVAFVSPIIVWVAAFSPHLVAVTVGAKWTNDAPLVIVALSIYLVVVPWFSPISVIDVLKNRPDVTFVWNAANLTVRTVALLAASGFGLAGAMLCYGGASLVMWLIYGAALAWLLGCGQGTFWLAIVRHLPLLLLFAAAQFTVAQFITHPLLGLTASVIPAGIYVAIILRNNLLRGVVTQLLHRKQSSATTHSQP